MARKLYIQPKLQMIINHNRLVLVLMNEKYYRRTWEKFDPVDFKKTFVLYDGKEDLFLDNMFNNRMIAHNKILQRTVTNDPI